MPQSLTVEQKQTALKKVINRLKPAGKYGAQFIMYATALGAIATIGGHDVSSIPLNILIGSVGYNLLSNIIERVALGEEISDEVLQNEVETAIQKSDLEALLTKDDFYRAIAKIIRNQDKILNTTRSSDVDIRRLSNDIEYLIQLLSSDSLAKLSTTEKHVDLTWSYLAWNELPDLTDFTGRDVELKELEEIIQKTKRVIVYGISGTGKTLAVAKLAENLKTSSLKVCWISLNAYLEVKDMQSLISRFLLDNKIQDFSSKVGNSEPAELVQTIAEVLLNEPIYLFLDSLNSANQSVQKFVEELLSATIKLDVMGGLLISSTYLPSCYSRADVLNNKVFEFGLMGFSFDETVDFFKDISALLTRDSLYRFYEAVGGHPMSILFLRQLIQNSSISEAEIEELQKQGVEASRDWMFTKVFSILNKNEQRIILSLSIFDYAFEDNEVEIVLPSSVRPQFALMPLVKRHFIHYVGDRYVLHDAIRSLSYEMIAQSELQELHRKVADWLYEKIKIQMDKDEEGAELEIGYKWCYHVENLLSFSSHEQTIRRFLSLDNRHLSALLAVVNYGYPFDFDGEDLDASKAVCKSLISKKLIKRNLFGFTKLTGPIKVKREYLPVKLDYLDIFFLECLCRRRGVANSMGYFDMPKENFAFYKQGLICQWEHYIELQPLLSDYESLEAQAKSCPIFGHCCPGGESQVEICKDFFQ